MPVSDKEPLRTYLWKQRPSAREVVEVLLLGIIVTIISSAFVLFGIHW